MNILFQNLTSLFASTPSLSHNCHSSLKKNWLSASERVECYIATIRFKYWNGTVPSHVNDMFNFSYNRYNTRSKVALYLPLTRQIQDNKTFSFFGPSIWTNVSHSTKNVKVRSFSYLLRRERDFRQTV